MGCRCVRPATCIKNRDIRDKYRIGRLLGEGAFGQVRECVDRETSEVFGVKIMEKKGHGKGHWSNENMIKREFSVLQSLDHPNIVRVYGFFEDRHFLYAVMEKCDGGELFEALLKRKHFDESDAATLCKQMLGALRHVHSRSVVHRDIKAENFLFKTNDPDSTLKLIDFGMSAVVENGGILTDICGSPHYLSPELLNRKYDHKVDIWAFGILVYLLIFGKYPFDGDTTNSIASGILYTSVVWSVRSIRPTETAVDFMKRLLERDPAKRSSASEALQHCWLNENSKPEYSNNLAGSIRSAHQTVLRDKPERRPRDFERRNRRLTKLEKQWQRQPNKSTAIRISTLNRRNSPPEYSRPGKRMCTTPSRLPEAARRLALRPNQNSRGHDDIIIDSPQTSTPRTAKATDQDVEETGGGGGGAGGRKDSVVILEETFGGRPRTRDDSPGDASAAETSRSARVVNFGFPEVGAAASDPSTVSNAGSGRALKGILKKHHPAGPPLHPPATYHHPHDYPMQMVRRAYTVDYASAEPPSAARWMDSDSDDGSDDDDCSSSSSSYRRRRRTIQSSGVRSNTITTTTISGLPHHHHNQQQHRPPSPAASPANTVSSFIVSDHGFVVRRDDVVDQADDVNYNNNNDDDDSKVAVRYRGSALRRLHTSGGGGAGHTQPQQPPQQPPQHHSNHGSSSGAKRGAGGGVGRRKPPNFRMEPRHGRTTSSPLEGRSSSSIAAAATGCGSNGSPATTKRSYGGGGEAMSSEKPEEESEHHCRPCDEATGGNDDPHGCSRCCQDNDNAANYARVTRTNNNSRTSCTPPPPTTTTNGAASRTRFRRKRACQSKINGGSGYASCSSNSAHSSNGRSSSSRGSFPGCQTDEASDGDRVPAAVIRRPTGEGSSNCHQIKRMKSSTVATTGRGVPGHADRNSSASRSPSNSVRSRKSSWHRRGRSQSRYRVTTTTTMKLKEKETHHHHHHQRRRRISDCPLSPLPWQEKQQLGVAEDPNLTDVIGADASQQQQKEQSEEHVFRKAKAIRFDEFPVVHCMFAF